MKQDIRFVDLKTGNVFDGSAPYIFWMDGEQSINLIYSKPICFISELQEVVVYLKDQTDIFQLIDPSKLLNHNVESIYGFEYHDLKELKTGVITSKGTLYRDYYVHMVYIIASASQAGEYRSTFVISGRSYEIGADFYGENEELYINMSNNNIEIPEIVQKAIYGVNIHEEKRDNITLNRKWKELLSNYWDVVANKGSYKSLYNSLKWFEYGDRVRLCEIWENINTNRYFAQDVQQLLSEKFAHHLSDYIKTTHFALYHALEEPMRKDGNIVWDAEKNPKLQYIESKWSTQDLALKLCMLGNFYETYFMPIHIDLIHSTIEDVVYTNTFKVEQGVARDRSDFVYFNEDIKCNVKDGDVFRLDKVDVQVGPETLFGLPYEDFENTKVLIGVQKEPVEKLNNDNDWKQFASQLYSHIGSVIDFEIEIPMKEEDQIKREVLIFKTFIDNEWKYKTVTNYKLLGNKFSFSLFCPIEGEYDVRLQFDSIEGKVYTKHIKFNVIDTQHVALNVYKIHNLQNLQILDEDILDKYKPINDYIFTGRDFCSQDIIQYSQYIPVLKDNLNLSDTAWKGVCLNHLLIYNGDLFKLSELNKIELDKLKKNYFIKIREVVDPDGVSNEDKKYYTICISKIYGFKPEDNINIHQIYDKLSYSLYREDYIFVPEFHKLVPLDNERYGRIEDLQYYTVTDKDALCVVPDIAYGKCIAECDWEFINASKPLSEPIKLSYIKEPFITGDKKLLEPGYYNIRFHYRLTNENKINTIELDSAFKKV